jgi:putative hydrolase of the HAD superfamily
MGPLKAILTDLDGVIRHWNSDSIHKKEIECGVESGYLYSICFEENLLSQVITGQISDDEWRNSVQTKLSGSMSESSAKELVDSWTHSEVYIDKTIIEIYKDHYPNAKVVLATNATSRLNQDMKDHGLENLFDSVFNSSELGVAKPSGSFFIKAMSELGVGCDEIIYVDDSSVNIQSAAKLGIRCHHYQNHTRLVEFLAGTQRTYSTNSNIQSECRASQHKP